MKRKRCGVCPGCLATECGTCRYCLDMKKRGGSGTLRRPCERRGCVATSSGENLVAGRSKKPRAAPSKVLKRSSKKREVSSRALQAKTVKVDGRVFGAAELCALCEAVGEEPDASINWATVAARLDARDVSFDALLTLRRAATRLEDEARAAEQQRSSKSASSFARHRDDDPPLAEEPSPRASGAPSKWSPARCQVLWRWVAYARAPPERTTEIDDNDSDDDDFVVDPFEFAYRGRAPSRDRSRLGDLEAAALLCASMTGPQQPNYYVGAPPRPASYEVGLPLRQQLT
ncbi:hypothetical protein CTAYLR_010272 [Chrysophaeum taylorii]|uniref:CXXC-type domain-containing protein n=1 Tax=Chrysophaeum taylorii TaxID=2483200 RepID=A0AAD7XI04_9STRA|nr:hypothetical protein CTAYLR_010272 [Chrysophaeum taylorii]